MHYALKEFAPSASKRNGPALAPCSDAVVDRSKPDGGCDALAALPRPLGLSKGHISPRPTTTFHRGGSLIEIKRPQGEAFKETSGEAPPREEVTEFSRKSRQRLRLDLSKVDQTSAGRPLFVTLTYPAEFPLDAETFKRHLDVVSKRIRRAYPVLGAHWKLEFQKRGAAHFHIIAWNIGSADLKSVRAWFALNWFEVVNSGDTKHLQAGTSVEVIRSQFAIMRYVGPYLSKDDQSSPGLKVGRYWGHIARGNIPYAQACTVELTEAEALLEWRTARRYMVALNRKRRLDHCEKHLPRSSADYFNGRLRRLRKQLPTMQIFTRCPAKFRPNENTSINLFCDASQWCDAFERLHVANERLRISPSAVER